jgi:hypothetical protein
MTAAIGLTMDLKIESLRINMANAAGHEHRVRPIAARAAALLMERLEYDLQAYEGPGSGSEGSIIAQPVAVNLNNMTDEQVAESIARAWHEALALKLR